MNTRHNFLCLYTSPDDKEQTQHFFPTNSSWPPDFIFTFPLLPSIEVTLQVLLGAGKEAISYRLLLNTVCATSIPMAQSHFHLPWEDVKVQVPVTYTVRVCDRNLHFLPSNIDWGQFLLHFQPDFPQHSTHERECNSKSTASFVFNCN